MKAIPLTFPSAEDKIFVYTDASKHSFSGVPLAEREREAKTASWICSYTLKKMELKYTIFSKILLSLVKVFKKYSHLLVGKKVFVFYDNFSVVQALRKTTDSVDLCVREQRYLAFLSEFCKEMEHIRSRENYLAFLSCLEVDRS